MDYRLRMPLLMDGTEHPEGALIDIDDEREVALLLEAGVIEPVQPDSEKKTPVPADGKRAERIMETCADIIAEARVDELTAAGLPTVTALEERLNEAVTAAERDRACKALAAREAGGQ